MNNRGKQYDIIVIGGGIMGSSVAYYSAKEGKKVLVVEKMDQASGSAGATDGVVGYHTKKPGLQLDLAIQSIDMFSKLSEELGMDIEYEQNCGGLQPVEDQYQWDLMEAMAKEQSASGVDIRMISIEEAMKLEPQLSPKLKGALYSETGGKVNPMRLTFAFAKAAQKLGAEFLNNTAVTGVLKDEKHVYGVETDKGSFYGDKIVIAAGSWSGKVGQLAGLELPIKPRKGQIVITEQIGPFMKATVQCARYNVIKFRPETIKDENIIRTGASLSIEQTEDGAMVIGATREFADFDRENTLEGIEMIVRRAAEFFPALEDVHVVRSFAGLRPYTPDGLPLIGKVDALSGLYVAAGHEGDGIALSPITGKLLAEEMVYGKTSYPITAFSPNRFCKELVLGKV